MPPTTHTFEIGRYRCLAIYDGGHMGSAGPLFTNAPAEQLDQALQAHQLEPDRLPSAWTCLLVNTGERTLLVDTGIGTESSMGGHLFARLEEAGHPTDTIDTVFLTHGHPDHIGGCTDAEGRPIFSQARYVMGRTEYEFWTSEAALAGLGEMMAGFARKNLLPIEEQLELVEGGEELLPGIRALEAFGHTPGHMGLEIESEGETLLHLADSALHPLHIEHPAWVAQFDMQPDQTVTTRRRLLTRASRGGQKALFYHFDFPGLGRVIPAGDGWRWEPKRE